MHDQYVNIAGKIPIKTLQAIEKLREEYGLSRANMIMRLLEYACISYGERIENSSVTTDGARNEAGRPINVNNALRTVL